MRLRHESHAPHCYACSLIIPNPRRNQRVMAERLELYERVVELVEDWIPSISVTRGRIRCYLYWDDLPNIRRYTMNWVVDRAVADMILHGVLVRESHGAYRVQREDDKLC